MSLFDHHVDFLAALRSEGVTVSVAEGLDAVQAVTAVGLADRESLRAAYAATLVKRHVQRPVFDSVFDLWYPRLTGSSQPQHRAPDRADVTHPDRLRLRAELQQALLTGDDAQLQALAREAVNRFGAISAPAGSPAAAGHAGAPSGSSGGWSALTALELVSPRTLLAGLLSAVLATGTSTATQERAARATLTARIDHFEALVTAEVNRRRAELGDRHAVARTAVRPSIDRVAFLSAGRAQVSELRREIQPLARRLAARLAVSQRHGQRGQLDFRRTIRAALASGGVPMQTRHRPRHPVKTDLVVLCDVSESVSAFAQFTLLLVYALREQFGRVRSFAFIDDVDEVTRFFAPGVDIVDTVARLTSQAQVGRYGRTDYGRAFDRFAERYPDALGRRTSLLVLGDARSNYGNLELGVLAHLVARVRHSYWLNPESRDRWDTGDSAASQFQRVLPMIECRNLAQLGDFVRELPVR